MKSRVAVVWNTDIMRGIPEALELLDRDGEVRSIFEGLHVAVKPNDTWAEPGDTTACTQADTVRAMIGAVRQFGPSRLTVTGGAGAGQTDEIFGILGIDRVIREEGVEFFDHNRPPFRAVKLARGPQEKVMVNPNVFRYETLVSLAQLKVHHTAAVTLSMKNIAMSFPAADYYGHPRAEQLHGQNFFGDMHGFIAGMCERFPIDLAVIVGHPAMTVKGPIGGRTFETGLVIMSTDFVAADTVGARILGVESVKHLRLAAEAGLGTADLADIELAGLPLDDARAAFLEAEQKAG